MTDKTIRVGVGVLIVNDTGEVLLGKRQGSHQSGTWGLIGGYVEFGEDFVDTAKREALEETGLIITDVQVLKPVTYFFDDGAKHHVSIYLIARIASGIPEIKEPHKMTDLRFFAWDALPSPTFVDYPAVIDHKLICGFCASESL